jgi:hypothetical protein
MRSSVRPASRDRLPSNAIAPRRRPCLPDQATAARPSMTLGACKAASRAIPSKHSAALANPLNHQPGGGPAPSKAKARQHASRPSPPGRSQELRLPEMSPGDVAKELASAERLPDPENRRPRTAATSYRSGGRSHAIADAMSKSLATIGWLVVPMHTTGPSRAGDVPSPAPERQIRGPDHVRSFVASGA